MRDGPLARRQTPRVQSPQRGSCGFAYSLYRKDRKSELRRLALGAGEAFRGRLTDEYWTPKHELYHN